MATTTPNYGWSVPTSSDLVKNGATAIETLGDAVDDALWNSGFGQAGKNKIINGDFAINQRSATSTTTSGEFVFDRFKLRTGGTSGTTTYSAQTFTPGAAPVAGYESKNYARLVTSGFANTNTIVNLRQTIEDVRTFAAQTITVSFWAKAATGTPNVGVQITQDFGSGGSAAVNVDGGVAAITTSWARYSFTVNVPSISGKTIGNSSYVLTSLWVSQGSDFTTGVPQVGLQNNTFDIWGVQVEYGLKATPFQTASGGSPQAELAMCQRYYWRTTNLSAGTYPSPTNGVGIAESTTAIIIPIQCPVTMRTDPSTLDYSGVLATDGVASLTPSTIALNSLGGQAPRIKLTVTGATQYRPYFIYLNSSNTYLGLGAEL